MQYYIVDLCKFNDEIIYLNSKTKTGDDKNPFKYFFEPILEYEKTIDNKIIVSIDKKGKAREILTDIEIPIIYKDTCISYNYEDFKYVKNYNNVLPLNQDIYIFVILNRVIYQDFNKNIILNQKASYEDVKKYIIKNEKKIDEIETEIKRVFKEQEEKIFNYKNKDSNNENYKIKKLINNFKYNL